jgi:outer membrane murein-binding lipoprotein Lpp
MNPFEMVAFIVAAVMIGSVLRARYQSKSGNGESSPEERAEVLRLRDDVKFLKQRVQVLEQIVTDRGAETASQIEALREGNRITERDRA